MAYSDADEALTAAAKAAKAMEDAGRRWGRASKELELAAKAYETAVEDYYDALNAQRERHWAEHCDICEGCEECRMYDV